ncbi:28S ribosomal protein S31, mitochondrial-like isoform X2 [Pomacea canaliculata]|uniref:28S ribosomal protein S31, mitochondrial-like isoform X2 n=1 Tax=Pomacea canaliculata TaxID=400727 RepID=UPI000D73ED6B|nr:28S ribosomal protein S31, mitochondrial-like isoform X2 [Pomacea canaliculata]
MLRRVLISLHKLSLPERYLLVCQPRRTVSLSSCAFAEENNNEISSSSSSDSESSDSDTEKGAQVDQELQKAAESVAKAVPGRQSEVKSNLLQQLKSYALLSKMQAEGQPPPDVAAKVSNLLSGMRVAQQRKAEADRQATYDELQTGRERRPKISQQRGPTRQISPEIEAMKLFHGPDLGIFTADVDQKAMSSAAAAAGEPSKPDLWSELYQAQLMRAKRQSPSNAFEEMIEWTDSGKLWTFPINNEQGMDEVNVGFHQHVFLEDQITDFPRRGPIRHFMELVIIGLSKNPYLTVQQKHEHIDWFRQYFKENKSILEETLGKDGIIGESASTN